MKVLITCPRAPISIEWAKICLKNNHEVFFIDSLNYPIGKFLKNTNYIKIPSPRLEFESYEKELIRLSEDFDMIIPNCEDIFYLSKVIDKLNKNCFPFMPNSKTLFELHNKYDFFSIISNKIIFPETKLISDSNEINLNKRTILKPIFSRFGSNVIRNVNSESIKNLDISNINKWVQQEFIEGEQICSYAICQNGNIIEQVVYKPKYLVNEAAGTYFENIIEESCIDFMKETVSNLNYTGQIAFDFIKTKNNKIYVIECNPRGTSGLHFISDTIILKDNNEFQSLNKTISEKSFRIGNSLLFLFLIDSIKNGKLKDLIKDHFKAKNVLKELPYYSQYFSFYEILKRKILYKKDFGSVSTFDIEYDGIDNEKF